VAICAIFRDEAPYLLEWLAYHKLIGVSHFVLYDNRSVDGGARLISDSEFASDVTLLDWADRPGQFSAYHHFCIHHAQRFTWVAFIDIDEFIFPIAANSIHQLLPVYEACSAVLLNWSVFGASANATRPRGLVIENYLMRVPAEAQPNQHVKSIVRTEELIDVGPTPHVLVVLGPSCNARGEQVEAKPFQSPCSDVMVVNHYFTKSEEDWSLKVRRGRADTDKEEEQYAHRQKLMFASINDAATVRDERITRFAPAVHKLLARNTSLLTAIGPF
jgi:hypothetical protein